MDENHTAAVVQRYLDALDGDTPAAPIIAALLDRAVGRLEMLCGSMLYQTYHRLTQPPLSLQTDEVLGAAFERLVKAMRGVRPPGPCASSSAWSINTCAGSSRTWPAA
jgi:hypothetical protein